MFMYTLWCAKPLLFNQGEAVTEPAACWPSDVNHVVIARAEYDVEHGDEHDDVDERVGR